MKKVIGQDTKDLIDKLLLEKIPLAGIARVAGVSERWLQAYVNQDLRKSHLNGRMLELLNQVVREHPMLELINGLAALVGERFEPSPHEQRTGNVIASQDFWGKLPPKTLRLNAGFAALTGF